MSDLGVRIAAHSATPLMKASTMSCQVVRWRSPMDTTGATAWSWKKLTEVLALSRQGSKGLPPADNQAKRNTEAVFPTDQEWTWESTSSASRLRSTWHRPEIRHVSTAGFPGKYWGQEPYRHCSSHLTWWVAQQRHPGEPQWERR